MAGEKKKKNTFRCSFDNSPDLQAQQIGWEYARQFKVGDRHCKKVAILFHDYKFSYPSMS